MSELVDPSGRPLAGPELVIAIATHDSRIHTATMGGLLEATSELGPGLQVIAQGGFLPRQRDVFLSIFLHSRARRLLFLDSDIGFAWRHVAMLLALDVDVVSGVYSKKDAQRSPTASGYLGRREGDLVLVESVPAGFLMLSRRCVEQMHAAHSELAYGPDRQFVGCFLPKLTPDGSYLSEDWAFCARWRAIGGSVWVHAACIVDHYGEQRYVPAHSWG